MGVSELKRHVRLVLIALVYQDFVIIGEEILINQQIGSISYRQTIIRRRIYPMTFAEIFILVLVIALVFYFLNPLRRRLETRLYKAFRSKSNSQKKYTDIPLKPSDYTKKENIPHE